MKKLLLVLFPIVLVAISELYAQATIQTGSMGIVVNSYGRIRVYLPSSTGTKQIERISNLVGIGKDAVYDYQNDADAEEPTTLVSSPQLSDFEITGVYTNAYSSAPPDVAVKYNIYSWNNAKYALLKFTITNRETNAINAKIGLDINPNIDALYGYDTVSYNNNNQIIRFHRGLVNAGLKALSHPLHSLYSFEWYDGYYVDSSYWNWLNYGSIQDEYIGDVEGPVTITSLDFINLNSSEEVETYYALAFGDTEQEMIAQIAEAQNKYNLLVSVEDNILPTPSSYTLDQNYPNPFNPSTKISYQLPQNGFVSLKIYNAIGKEVATLVNEEKSAGRYEVNFDATGLTSGVYFYTITANNFTQTNKMLLIK